MFRRSNPSEAVRSHRRPRPSPWQWLAAPARRAAVLAVSGALALAGVVVAVATVGTPEQDTASTQADGGSTGAAATSSAAGRSSGDRSPSSRSPSRSGSRVTGSAAPAGGSATTSPASGGPAARLNASGVLGDLAGLTQLTGSSARTLAGSPTPAPTTSRATQSPTTPTAKQSSTTPTATQSPTPSSPLPTLTPTPTSPLPTLTPGKPPGSSLHPTPGHGATHATDQN